MTHAKFFSGCLSAICFALGLSATAQDTSERPLTQADLDELSISVSPSVLGLDFLGGAEVRRYPFPAKRDDLTDGVYWQVTGHSSGPKRDLSATRFNPGTGRWTTNHPASTGLQGDARRLIWDVPVYAPTSGIVLSCWRNVLDGDDPGDDGCGKNPVPGAACITPAGGNFVSIWSPEDERLFQLFHFKQGTVPSEVCPHNETYVEDWNDKSGAFGMNPDVLVPFPFIRVEEGDLIGHVGNSGRSGASHLHMQLRDCSDSDRPISKCPIIAMHFNEAEVAQKTSGRDVRDDEWVGLNGALSVLRRRQIVLPGADIDDFIPPVTDQLELSLVEEGFAQVVVDVVDPAVPVSEFEWELTDPNDPALVENASMKWTVNGSCESDIASLRLDAPNNLITQTFDPGRSEVTGTFDVLSFAPEELQSICLDWAEAESSSQLCAQAPEQCNNSELINLLGGDSAGVDTSVVEVQMTCQNGATLSVLGTPALTLRCGAVEFNGP